MSANWYSQLDSATPSTATLLPGRSPFALSLNVSNPLWSSDVGAMRAQFMAWAATSPLDNKIGVSAGLPSQSRKPAGKECVSGICPRVIKLLREPSLGKSATTRASPVD